MFLPEDGELWESQDESQEEFRIFAHYAIGEGAEDLREQYRNNASLDLHQWTADYTGVPRKIAKAINFGSMYGMGVHKLAIQLGLPVPPPWPDRADAIADREHINAIVKHRDFIRDNYEVGKLFYGYHDKFKCMKATSKEAEKRCKARGYAKTLLGRQRPLYLEDAWNALNTAVQGTGGDIMKLWLVKAYEAGLFEVLTPLLTVHDEIDVSKPQTKEGQEAADELQQIGETCIDLQVPLKVDKSHGPNWAEVVDYE
jgi:DNA polymerase-1